MKSHWRIERVHVLLLIFGEILNVREDDNCSAAARDVITTNIPKKGLS